MCQVPGIDADIANDADTYQLIVEDGKSLPPPYHCYAAFLGTHLESVSCCGVPERETILELQGKESILFTLRRAVQTLTPTIRSFNAREKGLVPWPVSHEDDVRDLLYVMLNPCSLTWSKRRQHLPWLEPTSSWIFAARHREILIEVKWVGRRGQWKTILDQIHVDVQSYPTHESCATLVFVVVDAVRDIADPRLVEHELSGAQTVRGRTVDVQLYIVEP
jgi:REase_DpnII-MboI